MPDGNKKRASGGSIAAYALFAAYIAAIGLGAAYRWTALDQVLAAITLAAMALGSIVVLWRAFKHRKQPGGVRLGQMAALPESWRKWMLGEVEDEVADDPAGQGHRHEPDGQIPGSNQAAP